jgi:RNA recognition motif-containing protein
MEMEPGKLFIGGISWDTNEDRLREYFQCFGEVVEAVIMKDRATGRARGFGFVVFADPTAAERVVMEKHVIDGRTVSLYVGIHIFVSALFAFRTILLYWFPSSIMNWSVHFRFRLVSLSFYNWRL